MLPQMVTYLNTGELSALSNLHSWNKPSFLNRLKSDESNKLLSKQFVFKALLCLQTLFLGICLALKQSLAFCLTTEN